MPLIQGQLLNNRYRIARLIGQGGFGAVYRAWDTAINQPVAIKENLDTGQEAQKQFYREASFLARLRHPNLPRVTDHFTMPGQGQYLVMDFVEGQNLKELLLTRGQPFSEVEALPWIEQIFDALTYLHGLTPPIIHRDIKPANIIITPDGKPMLVDFGISKIYNPDFSTTVGAKAVTPGYSPPEQYGGGMTDARADIYAMGAMLYTMLTGKEPPESVQRMAGAVKMTAPRQVNAQITPTLEAAILKAMEVNTTQRFQNVAEFRRALHHSLAVPLPKKKRGGLIWLLVGGGMIMVLGVAILLAMLLTTINDDPTKIPTELATVTEEIAAAPTETMAVTETPSLTPSLTATVTAFPPTNEVVAPTEEPTATPTFTRTSTPTRTATATRTSASASVGVSPTFTLSSTSTTAPAAAGCSMGGGSASSGGGLPLTFESFGNWVRGNENNGAIVSTGERVHGGAAAARICYNFPTESNDYVVFLQFNAISGSPNALQLWVYGDGTGHYFNIWIQDSDSQTWQVPMGRLTHTGWQQMTGFIQTGQVWPWQAISGTDNGIVDYPIQFRAFVIDDRPDTFTGESIIYVDDLTATTLDPGNLPPTATPGSGNAAATATPSAVGTTISVATLPPGSVGQILYTASNTLMTTNPDWSMGREVGTVSSNTCGTTATTVSGQSYNLFRGYRCGIPQTISTCASPNGAYEIVIDAQDPNNASLLVRPTGNASAVQFVYQGVLDLQDGLQWSPGSTTFLFSIGTDTYAGYPSGGYDHILSQGYEPFFSPNGSSLLYRKPVGPGVYDIFVSNADGSNERNVTNASSVNKTCAVWRN